MGDTTTNDTLKESLGLLDATNDDFVSFAIDSDDEEEEEMAVVPPVSAPVSTKKPQSTSTSTSTSNSNTGINSSSNINNNANVNANGSMKLPLKKQTVTANDDPLSMLLHSSANVTDASSIKYTHANSQHRPTQIRPTTNTNNSSTNTNTNTNTSNSSSHSTSNSIYSTTNAAINSVNVNTQAVTQSLSSTFSSFASKFQDAVSHTTSRTGTSTGIGTTGTNTNTESIMAAHAHQSYTPSGSTGPPNNHHNNVNVNSNTTSTMASGSYVERSLEHSYSGLSTASNVTYTSHSSSSNPTSTIYNTTRNTALKPNQAYVGGSGGVGSGGVGGGSNLDNATKSTLVTSAIGDLLPGERVIAFLSNLLQVRDSSSPQTGIGSSPFQIQTDNGGNGGNGDDEGLIWCCVITFYRLVLFSYYESEFIQNLQNVNANDGIGMTGTGTGKITQDGISDQMKSWMQSASVSRQCQHMHTSYLQTNGKRHHVLQMPLASVDRIEKTTEFGVPSNASQGGFTSAAANLMGASAASIYSDSIGGSVASGTLVVYGKDNGRFLQFTAPSYADAMRAYEALNTYAFPGRRNLGYLFAFESRRAEVMASSKAHENDKNFGANGAMRLNARATPRRYEAMAEFNRMVSRSGQERGNMSCPWTPVLRANSTYNLCSSYPSVLFAPCTVDDGKPDGMRLLRDTASFRSGGRLQTMSWASRYDGASLWRSAQPKVGLQGNRSPADELFMKKIGDCAALANSQAAVNDKMPPRPSVAFLKMLTGGINESDLMLENFRSKDAAPFNEKCMLKIFDLRPKSSAMANRTAGYGYENTSHYKNTTLSFFGIGNIHAVRDSYKKISALCANPATNDVQWMQLVEDTKWLSFIRLILSASWQAAFHVRYNRLPVLLHCSHGWDRTSQVCALAQIFLDPYYRTRAGFSCLVEKDFLALGHPLHTRCGHGEGKGGDQSGSVSSSGQSDEISPIFLQFIDCVFQIVNQYPDYFEFNTKYLLLLSEHIYSCRFGTLLCDTEREREVVASIRQRTYSLWEYLESFPDLVNKSFSRGSMLEQSNIVEDKGCLLMPLSSLLRNVTLWVDRHCMHGAKATLRSIPVFNDSTNRVSYCEQQHPLHSAMDFKDNSIKMAWKEASRWKEIAKQREEEMFALKIRLKEVEEKNAN